MSLFRSTCLLLGSVLLLTACGDGGSNDPTGSPPANEEGIDLLPEPEQVVTIRSLDRIDGAERVLVEGVGVDLPSGVTAETTQLGDGATQMIAQSPDQDRAHMVLTVTRVDGPASDADVFLNMRTTAAMLPPDVVPQRQEAAVEWDGMPPAWALIGEVDPGDGDLREFMYAVTRDEPGARVVGISVEAAERAVEDSIGYEMLRTVRFDEG